MKYKLLKQLREVGFPQAEVEGQYISCKECLTKGINGNKGCGKECVVYIPTLSELIDTCGNEFGNLSTLAEGTTEEDFITSWCAENLGGGVERIGKTPEEAVAKLFIELNK